MGGVCVKYSLLIFNFIFWIIGIALISLGAYLKSKYGDYLSYNESDKFISMSMFLIILGLFIFLIAFFGCFGVFRENQFLITCFAVCMAVILILEITAGILGYVYRGKVETIVDNTLNQAVSKYFDQNQPGAKTLLDWAQQQFDCCGIEGFNDYQQPSKNSTDFCYQSGGVASCYSDNKCDSGEQYKEGCKQNVIDLAENNMLLCGAVALAFAGIQILGLILACCLIRVIKDNYMYV